MTDSSEAPNSPVDVVEPGNRTKSTTTDSPSSKKYECRVVLSDGLVVDRVFADSWQTAAREAKMRARRRDVPIELLRFHPPSRSEQDGHPRHYGVNAAATYEVPDSIGLKYRAYPTKRQRHELSRAGGCCRVIYNRLQDENARRYRYWEENRDKLRAQYEEEHAKYERAYKRWKAWGETGEKPKKPQDLSKEFDYLRLAKVESGRSAYNFYTTEVRPKLPFLREVCSAFANGVCSDIQAACERFLDAKYNPDKYKRGGNQKKNKAPRRDGLPDYFPRKKRREDAFSVSVPYDPAVEAPEKAKFGRVWLPRIGWLKFRLHRPLEGKPKSFTVSHKAGRHYVSICCQGGGSVEKKLRHPRPGSIVGVDLNVKTNLAALSDPLAPEFRIRRRRRVGQRKRRRGAPGPKSVKYGYEETHLLDGPFVKPFDQYRRLQKRRAYLQRRLRRKVGPLKLRNVGRKLDALGRRFMQNGGDFLGEDNEKIRAIAQEANAPVYHVIKLVFYRLIYADQLGPDGERLPNRQRWRRYSSVNWSKAVRREAVLEAAIARARADLLHKISRYLVENYSIIGFEDLLIKNMTASSKGTEEEPGAKVKQKAGLNKSILDQGWGTLRILTKYKAPLYSSRVVMVDPKYTSCTCSHCGHVDSANRDRERREKFVCTDCGFTADADYNAACVIRDLVLEMLSGEERALAEKFIAEQDQLAEERGLSSPRPSPAGGAAPTRRPDWLARRFAHQEKRPGRHRARRIRRRALREKESRKK